MKNLITVTLVFLCVTAFAQQTETELIRSAFRLEKKAVVADFLQLTNDEATKFWPIYEKYEQERATIGTRRLKLITDYTNKYETMDDASADAMVKESGVIQTKEVALKEKYYNTVKKSISIKVASRFYQIEDVINIAVRAQLYSNLPMLQKK